MTDTGTTSMEAQIVGRDPPGVVVQVIDHREYTHHVLFDWDGDLIGHVHERYTEETQTDPEPSRILKRVQFRARYEAHRETDAHCLGSIVNIDVIEDAITVLEALDIPQIMDHFEPFLDTIRSPPVDKEVVAFTALFLSLNDCRDELVGQSDPITFYQENGELVNTDVTLRKEPDVHITIPPLEHCFACDKQFRDLIVRHLECQVRDLYYKQGRQPPERYRVEGRGLDEPGIVPFDEQAK
nr:hypothetical protein [Natrialba chahannaoensis]